MNESFETLAATGTAPAVVTTLQKVARQWRKGK
jgi:hypothetical protein